MNYLLIFLGGGIGAAARYGMQGLVHRFLPASFPYGTLTVNIVGSFVIGLVMSVFAERFTVQPMLRSFIAIGVLGGFTTFSSFSYETLALLRDGSYHLGMINITASVLGCLAAAWAGLALGRLL